MSARTTEQLVADKMIIKIKAEGNSNTTILIDDTLGVGFTALQESIADEIGLDPAIISRRLPVVPGNFGPPDTVLVIGNSEPFLTTSQIKERLRFATDVRFLLCWHSFFADNEFDNFEVVSDEIVRKTGPFAPGENIQYPLKIFQRTRVFV